MILGHGVELRGRPRRLDTSAPPVATPDPGAYQTGSRELRVGVDARRTLGSGTRIATRSSDGER
jgi:hypothetical protein